MRTKTFGWETGIGLLLILIVGVLPVFASSTAKASQHVLTIMEIQGTGQFSPYEGQIVTTHGVVTLYSSNGRDFWMQDPDGDGDPATSDGIVVDDGGLLPNAPEVGDMIRITAEVEEQQFGNALPLTRLDSPQSVEILSSSTRLPDPVRISDLPNESIAEGIAFWEPLEGMLVTVRSATVVAPTSRFGEFAMLTATDRRAGSGFFLENRQILLRSLGPEIVDYNPERILVDDTSLDEAIMVKPGDQVLRLMGVVDYTFGSYKLQPKSSSISRSRPPDSPASTRTGPRGDTAITTFNVQNLFDLVDNPDKADEGSTPTPDELETQLTKLAMAIEEELLLPEIIVVQEIENQEIAQVLADRVNAATGTDYVATSFETSDARGIEVGFLWNAHRVRLKDAFQLSDDIVPGVSAAFGPGSPSPGREPLVGVFGIGHSDVIIVGNHFKSKSGDDPLFGVNDPPVRVTELQRKAQAQVVRDYVNMVFSEDPFAMVMVTGDLNDFQFSEPGEGADHPVAIVAGGPGEIALTNLMDFERAADQYTFIFDGNSQVLDHMLVSPVLLDHFLVTNFLHFNASFPHAMGADPTTTLRSSDHDAIEGHFNLRRRPSMFGLTVLHNNDGESQLIDAGSGLEDFGGVARFATLVDDLRAEALGGRGARGAMLLSSGDNFLAGPEFNASLEKGVPFYDTIAMDLIGYDAMAIGNHEFDFGPDVLADFINGFNSPPPFVSANLDFSGEPDLQALVDQGVIVKSVVVESGGEEFGVVGATTPNLPFISSPRNVVVDPDVAGLIQAQIDSLEAAGVNKIVVISHLQNVTEDMEVASMLNGVDVMIAGGGDELLSNGDELLVPGDEDVFGPYPLIATDADGRPVPVVTTPGNYKYVGRLVVGFTSHGRVHMVDDISGLVRVAGGANPDAVTPDPDVQAQVVDPVIAALDALATNIVGVSDFDLDGRRSEVRSRETNEGNLIADALLWQADQLAASFGTAAPDVALQNGGGIRNDSIIPAGPISELDTFSMVPFPNFVSVFENIPREQFKEILENAVGCTQANDFTVNPNCGSGRFAQVAGFSFTWSESGTGQILDEDGNVTVAGTRVQEVVLDDSTVIVQNGAVVAGPDITVATIDFLARGGDQYPYRGAPFTVLGVTYQQALANYISDGLGGSISDAASYAFGVNNRIFPVP